VPDPAARVARVQREARLLGAVAAVSPLPVLEPSVTVPEQGCLAYPKVPGLPLLDLPQRQWSAHGGAVAATLGELLTALHAAPVARMAALVGSDDQPLAAWRATLPTLCGRCRWRSAAGSWRRSWTPNRRPAGGRRCSPINDLGIEHVLVDPDTWTVTRIIDWSDAQIVDPAVDFGVLYRDSAPPPPYADTPSHSDHG
jgi:aminoglycoside phosphotransferase (APT) family kinase protein